MLEVFISSFTVVTPYHSDLITVNLLIEDPGFY